jgi:hypothetical protein
MAQRNPSSECLRAAPLFAGLALALGLDGGALRAQSLPTRTIAAEVRGASVPHVPNIVVANCNDDGAGSLRAAVLVAASGDAVDLTQLTCSSITLSSGEIDIDQNSLSINGPGADALTINGGTNPAYYNRVFRHLGAGTLTIEGLTIAHGTRTIDDLAEGGCLFSNGDLQIFESAVDACAAVASGVGDSKGGAVFAHGEVRLFQSRVTGSAAFSQLHQALGGGIYSGSLSSKYSTIANNTAAGASGYYGAGGGFYWGGAGDVYLLATTVSGNHAAFDYGGLAVRSSAGGYAATIINSTISANSAAQFAGGAVFQIPVSISNSTIAFNTDGRVNSGAGLSINAAVTATLESTIVAMNLAGGYLGDVDVASGGTIAGANNLIVATSAALPADTIRDCPNLTPLAANGGLTRTNALLHDSPAIDAGSNTVPIPNDQRGDGFPRVAGAAADIGAYEHQGGMDDFLFAGDFENARCP